MPITSLPSPYGIGAMGQAARDFVSFLKAGGQVYWQILPIGQTSYGDSPYQSFSSYAGNPYLIDLDDLIEWGLLKKEEVVDIDWGADLESVDYGLLYEKRYPVLRLACSRLQEKFADELWCFCEEEHYWLEEYALFMALKGKHGGKAWSQWPLEEKLRWPQNLQAAREELADEIQFWRQVQFLFYRQWRRLRSFANENGISIIGDLPIYVAGDSADVWANPKQFQLDENAVPTFVAGCPPDGFSADGQLWGNPLFDWDYMKQTGYAWWISRIAFQFRNFDVLRIDHFRGFDEYFAIPFGDTTAKNGHWCKGPGIGFFQAVNAALGKQRIIAEDLGYLTDSVIQMVNETGYPGMKILEFAFDSRDASGDAYLPYNYRKNCVVYTGTHDNDTIQGWMTSAPKEDVAYATHFLRLNQEEGYHWGMMRTAWASTADYAIMQMQDLLGLGSEARINIPSTLGNNWKWRALPGAYNEALAQKLYKEMQVYHRLPQR